MGDFTPDDYVYPECGCRIARGIGKLAYCPKHKAAPEMYEALSDIVDDCEVCQNSRTVVRPSSYMEMSMGYSPEEVPCTNCEGAIIALALVDKDGGWMKTKYEEMVKMLDRMQTATSEMGVASNLKYAQELQPFALVEQLARIANNLDVILYEKWGYDID